MLFAEVPLEVDPHIEVLCILFTFSNGKGNFFSLMLNIISYVNCLGLEDIFPSEFYKFQKVFCGCTDNKDRFMGMVCGTCFNVFLLQNIMGHEISTGFL